MQDPARALKWDRRFLELTDVIARWSKDPSRGVGAVIVSPSRQIVATGFNGLPRGIEDRPERLERPVKYDLIVHAEMNAIVQCARNGVTPVGSTIYTSFRRVCIAHYRSFNRALCVLSHTRLAREMNTGRRVSRSRVSCSPNLVSSLWNSCELNSLQFASMPSSRAVIERFRPLVSSRTFATIAASIAPAEFPHALRT